MVITELCFLNNWSQKLMSSCHMYMKKKLTEHAKFPGGSEQKINKKSKAEACQKWYKVWNLAFVFGTPFSTVNETRTFSSETNVGSPDPERPCFSVFEASFFFFLRFRVNRVQRFAVSYSVVLLFQGKKYQENIVSTKSRASSCDTFWYFSVSK